MPSVSSKLKWAGFVPPPSPECTAVSRIRPHRCQEFHSMGGATGRSTLASSPTPLKMMTDGVTLIKVVAPRHNRDDENGKRVPLRTGLIEAGLPFSVALLTSLYFWETRGYSAVPGSFTGKHFFLPGATCHNSSPPSPCLQVSGSTERWCKSQ